MADHVETRLGERGIDRYRAARIADAYAEWRVECQRVRECYGRWSSTRGAEAALAFAACLAALDREERSARRLAETVARVGGEADRLLRDVRRG
jgi:hypothetical protein